MNVYAATDPYLAIGSITRRPGVGFTWHCHASGAELSGQAPDMETAERRLTNFLVMVDSATDERRLAS